MTIDVVIKIINHLKGDLNLLQVTDKMDQEQRSRIIHERKQILFYIEQLKAMEVK